MGHHGANVRNDGALSALPCWGPWPVPWKLRVSVVRPKPRPVASSVETEVPMVRPHPTGAEEEDEVAPSGEDLSSTGPESAV